MNYFTVAELGALRRLRERFLDGTAGARDYWSSEEELRLYDTTFGERIGWKWDAVLRELRLRGWQPESTSAIDWGCGSGVACRRVLAEWPQIRSLALHDRSPLAVRYAMEHAQKAAPTVEVRRFSECGPRSLLLASHVANELDPNALDRLVALAGRAHEIVWVEAGTHADSRRLIEIRERLVATGFSVIAPCTHQSACGMLAAKNARHWCHHFASPPSHAFCEGRWSEFAKEIGIDLRSLPYSFLVLSRSEVQSESGYARVIGEPREAKGHLKVLSCQAEGVEEFMLQKRDSRELYRAIRKTGEPALYRWSLEAGKIKGGQPLLPLSGEACL